MTKRPFFGFVKPKRQYSLIAEQPGQVKEIPLPKRVNLAIAGPDIGEDDLIIKVGDAVKTGQRVKLVEGIDTFLTSTVTGVVSGVSEFTGYLGKTQKVVTIDTTEKDDWDDEFKKAGAAPTPENASAFLDYLPRGTGSTGILGGETGLDTVVINGVDQDLLITINQFVVKTEAEALRDGIEVLKKVTGAKRALFVVPPNLATEAGKTGVEVQVVPPFYPEGLPKMIMKKNLQMVVPAGKTCEEMGVGFIPAEGVVALSRAFDKGDLPVEKMMTVIGRDQAPIIVRARVGTPVGHVLSTLNVETTQGDKLVMGGPMFGRAISSENTPVTPDTDAIMVQGRDQIPKDSSCQCVNCGECVRICPADIPVNMLVRVLENGLFEDAAKEYDLLSCIECGLCSYVCTSRIQIFQHIILGKYEFEKIDNGEEPDA